MSLTAFGFGWHGFIEALFWSAPPLCLLGGFIAWPALIANVLVWGTVDICLGTSGKISESRLNLTAFFPAAMLILAVFLHGAILLWGGYVWIVSLLLGGLAQFLACMDDDSRVAQALPDSAAEVRLRN